jgi:hypothetical protein
MRLSFIFEWSADSMTDRELLEAAAIAVGSGAVWWDSLGMGIATGSPIPALWNPLEHDGDALRLAVNLRMDISWVGQKITVNCCSEVGNAAAARRAIVRAAAALGQAI